MAELKRRDMEQTEYRAPNAVVGSLAYDLDFAEKEYRLQHAGEEQKQQTYVRPAQKQEQRRQTAVRPARALALSPSLMVCGVAILAVLLMTILGYVALNQVSSEIVELKEQVAVLRQENVDLTTKHELTFDLSTIKLQAEEFGMSKPSDSQMYYVDLSGRDTARVYETADNQHLMQKTMNSLKTAVGVVVEYFS